MSVLLCLQSVSSTSAAVSADLSSSEAPHADPGSISSRETDSPVPPEVPARPDALSDMKFKQLNKVSLERRQSQMITDAVKAATRASLAVKRRTMLEPERKIVKGPEGYRYEWRKDIALVQHFMWKRGGFRGGNKNWKRRWLVIRHNAIFYYRTSKPKLLGTVPLDCNSSVALLDGAACPKDVPKNCFAFVVKTDSRHLYIYTDSESIRVQWEDAVAKVVKNMRKITTTQQPSSDNTVKQVESARPMAQPMAAPLVPIVSPTPTGRNKFG